MIYLGHHSHKSNQTPIFIFYYHSTIQRGILLDFDLEWMAQFYDCFPAKVWFALNPSSIRSNIHGFLLSSDSMQVVYILPLSTNIIMIIYQEMPDRVYIVNCLLCSCPFYNKPTIDGCGKANSNVLWHLEHISWLPWHPKSDISCASAENLLGNNFHTDWHLPLLNTWGHSHYQLVL